VAHAAKRLEQRVDDFARRLAREPGDEADTACIAFAE
jgi:hypothetical protein